MRRFAPALAVVAVVLASRAAAQTRARYDVTAEEAAPTDALRRSAFEAALQHDHVKAAGLALQTYLGDRALYGPGHRNVTLDICLLALVHLEAGESEKADHLFARVLGFEPDPDGVDRSRVDDTVLDLEVALMTSHKDFEDESLFTELLRVAEAKEGPEGLAVGQILPKLGLLEAEWGSLERAEEITTRALHIFEKQFGMNDARLGDVLNKLAVYADLQCDEKASERYFVRAVNVSLRGDANQYTDGWRYLENYQAMLEGLGLVGPARHVGEIAGSLRCNYYPNHCVGIRPGEAR